MAEELARECDKHHRLACADTILHRLNDGAIGVVVHDGGGSIITIDYCPFCGASLAAAGVSDSPDETTLLREVIGACAPPVEALANVHADGKWIAPETLEGLRHAQTVLRKAASALAGVGEHRPAEPQEES